VITHKIARLIQAGMEPKRIAAITFTNKAAAEMRERAKGLIGRGAKEVLICTFHALGVRMMREDGAVLGLKPQFSILDSDDVTSILKDCGGTTDAATARQWQWAISLWKNTGLNAAQALAQAKDDSERITARIMARYEERLSAYQSVDFDDLIGLPLKLLAEFPEVRAKWQAAGPCAGGRIPGHQRHAVRGAQAAGGRSAAASPPWATTTSPSTAGAAPRWTT
jgi:ATP-dependent DNA helicase Rep